MFHQIDNDKREHEVQSNALQPYYSRLQHSISAYLLSGTDEGNIFILQIT